MLDLFHFQIQRILHDGGGETRSSSASRKVLSDEPSFQGAYHVGIGEANSRRSRTNNAVPTGGGPRILSTLVSSASPGDCGSMGAGVFGSG